jgi:hypothetical protein
VVFAAGEADPLHDNAVRPCHACGVASVWIDPAALGRPLDDVAMVYCQALHLARDDWRRCPADAVDFVRGVLMAVHWLDGTTDLGMDPSIPCPPRSRVDVERQARAAYRVLRWIGFGDRSASATAFAVWDMLGYALGRSDRSPVDKVLMPSRAA